MTDTAAAKSPVLVGVDDSPGSLEALRFAAGEAALRGTELRVVHIWHYPSTWGVPLVWPKGADPGDYVHQHLLDEVTAMQDERRASGQPAVTVTVEVIQGETDRELRSEAAKSMLLVLGQRGHHWPSDVLGRVSNALVAHPPCPVLIVPSAKG